MIVTLPDVLDELLKAVFVLAPPPATPLSTDTEGCLLDGEEGLSLGEWPINSLLEGLDTAETGDNSNPFLLCDSSIFESLSTGGTLLSSQGVLNIDIFSRFCVGAFKVFLAWRWPTFFSNMAVTQKSQKNPQK